MGLFERIDRVVSGEDTEEATWKRLRNREKERNDEIRANEGRPGQARRRKLGQVATEFGGRRVPPSQ